MFGQVEKTVRALVPGWVFENRHTGPLDAVWNKATGVLNVLPPSEEGWSMALAADQAPVTVDVLSSENELPQEMRAADQPAEPVRKQALLDLIRGTETAGDAAGEAGVPADDVNVAVDDALPAPAVASCGTIHVLSQAEAADDPEAVDSVAEIVDEGAEAPALDHVSFEVPAGSTVALVGPSGGGKTTAASLVPRFWDVDSGRVELGGADVRDMDPAELMDRVAFVFQANRPFKQTVLENVRAARPDATRGEALEALEAAQCGDILEKLPNGVDTLVGTGGAHLSGGEVQRLMIARAILKNAPVVVLDEATAFADPENEAKIQAAFKRLARGRNGEPRTVLMIAHRLSTVREADKIVVLDAGRVVEQGTHEELLAAGGLYARMWADYERSVSWRITSAREVE